MCIKIRVLKDRIDELEWLMQQPVDREEYDEEYCESLNSIDFVIEEWNWYNNVSKGHCINIFSVKRSWWRTWE